MANSIAKADTPIFKLLFNAGTQLHGSSGPFLGFLDYASPEQANLTIADSLKDYFLSFAIHLDPNVESWSNVSKPMWPDYKVGEAMRFTYTEIGAVSDLYYDNNERCRFFEANSEVVQN